MEKEDNDKKIIKLNVGGKTFYTLCQTLATSNYFQNLLKGDMQNPALAGSNNDEVFVDRDGDIFKHVIKCLRTGKIVTDEEIILQKLKFEAKYYQLENLVIDIDKLFQQMQTRRKEKFLVLDSEELINYKFRQCESGSECFQIIQSIETYESYRKCYMSHNSIPPICEHTSIKAVEKPVKKWLVRKYYT